jgi:hypothetical protein
MLLHANHRWTANCWPYALHMANDVLCEMPNMQHPQSMTPQQVFSNTNVNPNPKHWKPFTWPVYVLDNTLQSGTGIFHKWKQCLRVSIYIGQSLQHARSVALVLDRKTVLVSPQFHINFDPNFHAVTTDKFDSQWQLKTGFVGLKEPKTKEPQTVKPQASIQQNVRWNTPSEGAPKPTMQGATNQPKPISEIKRQLQHHKTNQAQEPDETYKLDHWY